MALLSLPRKMNLSPDLYRDFALVYTQLRTSVMESVVMYLVASYKPPFPG